MKLLFLTTRAFYPDSSGGAQKSSLYLFESLRKRGWQIEVICGLPLRSPSFRKVCQRSFMQLKWPALFTVDHELGYPCWRGRMKFSSDQQWLNFLEERLQAYQPDVVLGQGSPHCPLLSYTAGQGYSTFYFVRALGDIEAGHKIPSNIYPIANSPFTAASIAQATQNEVGTVLPFVDIERYRVQERQREYVTFINPVPEKGVDVAIKVAQKMPQIRFLFIAGKWSIYKKSTLESFLEPARKLPNVTIWPHQSDMRRVYSATNILLVPSQFTETFGRIIVEAQANGIPVVASQVGGIPYTLGQGGILVEPKDDAQAYVKPLEKLCTDQSFYAQLSSLAIENSHRPEFNPEKQVDSFVRFVERHISSPSLTTR